MVGWLVSVALRVLPDVLATLEDHPNRLYEHHYRQVNFALDRLAHLAVGVDVLADDDPVVGDDALRAGLAAGRPPIQLAAA